MRRIALLVALEIVVSGCPKRVDESKARPQVVKLISDTPESETTTLGQVRSDVEIDTRDHDRTPHVVATGETPLLTADGLVARLFGDEACTQGFSVDNFLLIEVVADNGQISDRMSVGFTDTVSIGSETIDNLGRRAFNFEPGEINLTSKLPDRPFKLRATALDYFGVGRVSDVYVALRPEPGERSGDELKGQ
ncbi:MAG: hypothetical protein IPJ65_35815 [Archangiaceae bacterium]|nr:hypothetical protein [Archangiaceae bacterium]